MKKTNDRKIRRTATELTAKAKNIMTYTLEGLIREAEPLFTAVYLSPSEETFRLWTTYPDSEEIRYIVREVNTYHTDMAVLSRGVANGFFNYEVGYLLNFAKKNRIAAARFIPIFYTALEHAEELGLSAELQEALKQHINHQKNIDGFVIVSVANGQFVLYFAEDVIPA